MLSTTSRHAAPVPQPDCSSSMVSWCVLPTNLQLCFNPHLRSSSHTHSHVIPYPFTSLTKMMARKSLHVPTHHQHVYLLISASVASCSATFSTHLRGLQSRAQIKRSRQELKKAGLSTARVRTSTPSMLLTWKAMDPTRSRVSTPGAIIYESVGNRSRLTWQLSWTSIWRERGLRTFWAAIAKLRTNKWGRRGCFLGRPSPT